MTEPNYSLHYPIQFDAIPASWATGIVNDVLVAIQPGFASGKHNQHGDGIPHLRPMNIDRDGRIDLREVKYVARNHALRLAPGDVLFNNTNSPALVGKTGCITTAEDWAFSNHMTRLRLQSGIDSRFIACQLHYLWTRGYFRHRCVNHVNQASISTKLLAETVPLVIPPSAEQSRIVAKLDELFSDLDAGVAALERARANLKRYRAAVLKAAVEGRLTEQWRAEHPVTEPASQLLARILAERRRKWEADQRAKYAAAGKTPPKNWQAKYADPPPPEMTELSELPRGWWWTTIDQLCFVDVGFAFKSSEYVDEGIRLLRGENIEPGSLRWIDVRCWERTKLKGFEHLLVEEEDIILAMDRPLISSGLKLARVKSSDLPCLLVQRVARLRMLEKKATSFLYTSMQTEDFLRHLLRGQTGTQLPHISGSGIASFATPLPPLEEQIAIAEEIDRRLSVIDAAEAQIESNLQRAARLRQSILKRAFEGKLVPQDPNDEPASVLLERIRQQRTSSADGERGKINTRRKGTDAATSRN
jgi:type I restriction enzyme S subunit